MHHEHIHIHIHTCIHITHNTYTFNRHSTMHSHTHTTSRDERGASVKNPEDFFSIPKAGGFVGRCKPPKCETFFSLPKAGSPLDDFYDD